MKQWIIGLVSCLLFTSLGTASTALAQNTTSQEVWNSIGGKQKWESTTYILFSVSGNALGSTSKDTRRYLIDKNSGKVRFEGIVNGTKHVFLFNYKRQRLRNVYDENGVAQDASAYEREFLTVSEQFQNDFAALSMPAQVATTVGGDVSTKLLNAERFINAAFQIDGKAGRALIAEDSGLIKRLEIGNQTITVDGYKDTGNGLILPTRFKNHADDSKSLSFQTIASFTSMEEAKFDEF